MDLFVNYQASRILMCSFPLQLSEDITGPPPTDDKSIEEESTWINSQLNSGGISPLVGYDQVVKEINKEEIGNVLTMMHVQKLDVWTILMYSIMYLRS